MLDRLKEFLRAGLGLSPDALLVIVGLGVFLAACLLARRPLTWPWALLPGLGLALLVEALEIWQHYGARGLGAATPGQLAAIALRHARDVLVMNLAPLLVFATALLLEHWSNE